MLTDKSLKWLSVCELASKLFSTCSKRQYFAIILDRYGNLLSVGYNGAPKGMKHCNEGGCPRAQEGSLPGSVYDNCISIHAETNAILHSNYTDRALGSTIYVNGTPCFSCAKTIANSGITKAIVIKDSSYAQWADIKIFMIESGIEVVEVEYEEVRKICVAAAGDLIGTLAQIGV